ncbi:MAG: 30S ribosomal protein S19 [Candidatus Hodgkinia cicadicola]
MARSSWKPPFVELALYARALANETQTEPFATRSRRTYVLPEFIGKVFAIHNGRRFIKLRVTEDMVGHKLGEFAPTRKPCAHKPH